MKKIIAVLAVGASLLFAGTAQATKPDPEHKVLICHRTAAPDDVNPYNLIEIDEAALDTHLNNGQGHPAKFNDDGSPRNDFLAPEGADDDDDCVKPNPTPTPTPTPTPEPTETPTPTDTPEPTVTPTPTDNPIETPTPDAPEAPLPTLPRTDTE